MLTYRIGSEGAFAGARAMALHVLQPTLPPDLAAAAAYYARVPGIGPGHDFAQTLPVVRPDIDPAVARLFALDPRRPVTEMELSNLLAGRRADGEAIPGRRAYRTGTPLAEVLGLPRDRTPGPEEIAAILSGRRADRDEALPPDQVDALRLRFLRLYGGGEGTTVDDVVAAVAAGRRLDGGPLQSSAILDGLTAVRQRQAFADLCWSAPKSVSVAIALAASEGERAVLMAAHRTAIERIMAHVEGVLGAVRRGDGGRGGQERGGIAWVMCAHWTARPTVEIPAQDGETGERYTALSTVHVLGDPQTHTHCLIPLSVLTETNHVGSVNTDLLRNRVHLWGRLYAALLATELRRAGVHVSLDTATATAKITTVPDAVCEAFSKRSRQGEKAAKGFAAARGIEWDALDNAGRIKLLKASTQGDGRAAKRDDIADILMWRAEAEAAGWSGGSVIDLDNPQVLAPRAERLEVAYRAAAAVLAREFEGRAVVDEARAQVAAAAGLIEAGIGDVDEVEAVAAMLIDRGVPAGDTTTALIVRMERGPRGGALSRLTTAAHMAKEEQLIALFRDAAADTEGALAPEAVEASMRALGLDVDTQHGRAQLSAAQSLGQARAGAALGVAGSGKTALVGGLVREWRGQRRRVIAVAPAWRQAIALGDAGIEPEDCMALAAFLARVRSGSLALDRYAVVVVDEAALLSVEDALQILELRAVSGFTVSFLGDPMQGQPFQAGGLMDLIARATGPIPTIATTVRQRLDSERRLAGLARDGEAAKALEFLRTEGRAHLIPGLAATVAESAAEAWVARRAADGEAPLVVVPTNSDARSVGDAIRRRLQEAGEIGPDRMEIDATNTSGEMYRMRLAVGDQVRLYARTHVRGRKGPIGVNGTIVSVREITDDGLVLENGRTPPAFVPWDNLRNKASGVIRLAHGHAATLASAQGATANSVLAVFPQGTAAVDAGAAYVALSRHRDRVDVLIGEGAERRALAERRSPTDVTPIRADAIWAAVAKNLSRREDRPTAHAFLDRAREVRRSAEDAMRAGAARQEARVARGEDQTIFPARGRQRRAQAILGPIRHVVAEAVEAVAALKAVLLGVRDKINGLVEEHELKVPPRPRPGRRRPPTTTPGGTALRR